MGCCNSNKLDTEISFLYTPTMQAECDERFNEIPLSSNQSPLHFAIVQEEKESTFRLSYENTNFSNIPHTKSNLEMAFLCGRV